MRKKRAFGPWGERKIRGQSTQDKGSTRPGGLERERIGKCLNPHSLFSPVTLGKLLAVF